MKSSRSVIFFFLSGLLVTLFTFSSLHAQDVATIQHDYSGTACWTVSIKNHNSGHQPINRVKFTLQTDQYHFIGNNPPNTWAAPFFSSASNFTDTAKASSINYNQTVSGFQFCIDFDKDNNAYDNQFGISWAAYNNSQLIDSGTLFVVPTTFQYLSQLDSVSATSQTTNGDPCFNFTLFNKNSGSSAIHSVSFQILDFSEGTIRPSGITAPAGWVLDSVDVSTAYFHAIANDLESGHNRGGFKVCLRANLSQTLFNFVWRAGTVNGFLDRDTVRNIAATVGSSDSSLDSISANPPTGCSYTFTVKNFHATNYLPPSRINQVMFYNTTPGVSLDAVTVFPANWGAGIRNGDTAIFIAASNNDALASGTTSNSFGIAVHNPTGGNFNLHWITSGTSGTISQGDLPLKCLASTATRDSATLSGDNSTCHYTLSVRNTHANPPSSLYAVGLQLLPGSKATFQASGSSDSSWTATFSPDHSSVRFQATMGTPVQKSGSTQNFHFALNSPPSGSNAYPVIYSTYDQAGSSSGIPLTKDTVTAVCTTVVTMCDAIAVSAVDSSKCLFNFTVTNGRGGVNSITEIDLSPEGGREIDSASASAPIGWTTKRNGKTKVVFTSGSGIGVGVTQGGFYAAFTTNSSSHTFPVDLATVDVDNKVCYDTVTIGCGGVSSVSQALLAKSMNLRIAPNPFHSVMTVSFDLATSGQVMVSVLDVLGRVRQIQMDGHANEGHHNVTVDGTVLDTGTYYVRITTEDGSVMRRIVLEK